jgi:hypothetical protein
VGPLLRQALSGPRAETARARPLPAAGRVSFRDFGSPLLDFVELPVSLALEQEHHDGLTVALARVVQGRATALLDWHGGAVGLDRAVTKRADSRLGDRSNGRDHHRGLTLISSAQHGAVFPKPMVAAEVLDHGSLAAELGASEQHRAGLVNQLELTPRRRQRSSSALRGGLWLWL